MVENTDKVREAAPALAITALHAGSAVANGHERVRRRTPVI